MTDTQRSGPDGSTLDPRDERVSRVLDADGAAARRAIAADTLDRIAAMTAPGGVGRAGRGGRIDRSGPWRLRRLAAPVAVAASLALAGVVTVRSLRAPSTAPQTQAVLSAAEAESQLEAMLAFDGFGPFGRPAGGGQALAEIAGEAERLGGEIGDFWSDLDNLDDLNATLWGQEVAPPEAT